MREWESLEAHQYVCNYVDPSFDAFVSELRITSPGKDILPDLEATLIVGTEVFGDASGVGCDVHGVHGVGVEVE